ncbi:hypothetical protein CRI94_05750 [Longibacter salinarum]|uniref:Glycosyl transferase n=1 Tax=Longibacter salinarum TaxID=1850348 RepID=A0A2A8D1J9_9BACT|nr:hypothetical protein [Longibacter salinarum]PEN14528.1 hypothetical protein CRI94_05750 [Longibacter salinarum]
MLEVLTNTFKGPLLSGAIAFATVVACTPLVIWFARTLGWVAHPREDRWHESSTALMGGIALYVGATAAVFVTAPVADVWILWCGATLMFVTGLIDDMWQIRPAAKLAAQVLATSVLLYAGYSFGQDWAFWLSLPLTLVWVVGVTNAINLLDNMDGLSAGIAGIAAAIMVIYAAMAGSSLAITIGAPVVGAALGFLVYNFKPAKIFMGDCGSLFLGYVLAALGLIIQAQSVTAGPVAVSLVPLAVLAVPIFDTTLVTLVRKLSGRPISQGGRDHSSHRLVFLGLSERHAVLMLYGLSLLSGIAALTALYAGERLFFALTAFVIVALIVLGIQLGRANVYGDVSGDGAPPRGVRPLHVLHRLMGHHWKALFGILADAVLVGAVFVVAHSLRFESGVPPAHADRMVQVLPLVVSIKIAVFYAFGLYRGIWRYAGTPELLRTGFATLAATAGTGGMIALMFGADLVSRGVLVIDWMMVTIAVTGVRFGFRGLRQYLAAKRAAGAATLLYGAAGDGTMAVRMIRHNDQFDLRPVGFVDDDALKIGLTVQGLPVLGGFEDIEQICKNHDIKVLLITADLPPYRLREVVDIMERLNVSCKRLHVDFESVDVRSTAPARPNLPISA